jgi:hypothetical protein
VAQRGSTLTVVTNFGVLTKTDTEWFNACDEAIGGAALQAWEFETQPAVPAQLDAGTAHLGTLVVQTAANGVFYRSANDRCSFVPRVLDDKLHWLLDYSMPKQGALLAQSTAEPPQFALLTEQANNTTYLVRGSLDGAFERLAMWDDASGYRAVQSGGNPPAVYATGYTRTPAEYRIAYSLNSGDTVEHSASAFDPNTHSLMPLTVDAYRPHWLYLTLTSLTTLTAEVWRFDAHTQELRPLFALPEGERLVGVVALEHALYVAASTDEIGTLYRATLGGGAQNDTEARDAGRDLDSALDPDSNSDSDSDSSPPTPLAQADFAEFVKLDSALPRLSCIAAAETRVLLCSADFTRASAFLVASGDVVGGDDAITWQPLLRVSDLGDLATCDGTCESSRIWLTGIFGALSYDPDASVASGAPSATSLPLVDSGHTKTSVDTHPADKCGACAIGTAAPFKRGASHTALGALLLLTLGLRRRQKTRGQV